jgi:excisionase family DNA binding protein
MSNDEWITVNEAAQLSGYNEEHITRLIRQGKINAKKFSTVWQVSRKSLLAYVGKTEKLGNKRGPKSKL